jgi:hypothetical protein
MEEQNVLMIACEDKSLLEEITKIASQRNIDVAVVDSSVLKQNLTKNKVADTTPDIETMDKFLANDENRQIARMQAEKLYAIMTGGGKQEDADKFVFSQKQIVHATTLSNKKFQELFNLLKAFNYVDWVDNKKHTLKFTFDQQQCLDCIVRDVRNLSKLVAVEVVRYKNYVKSITDYTDEQKEELYKKIRKTVIDNTKV